ncbi:MAG: hypothetical protein V7785_06510 [Bermanella sp.]
MGYFRKNIWLSACLVILVGCDTSQTQTIVTLHTKKAGSLKELIRESLGSNVKFSTSESQVIIFAQKKDIQPTLKLLEALDKWPSAFRVTLKAEKNHQYSTISSPLPFSLLPERDTLIKVKGSQVLFRLQQISKDEFLLKIKSYSAGKVIVQHILLADGIWLKTNLLNFENYPWIKIETQKTK